MSAEVGSASSERFAIGSVSRIPSPHNPSGFEPHFTVGRELQADELNQLRVDLALVRDHSTNSPAAHLSRTSTRLQELYGQAIGAWRSDESQPKVAHADGLTNLLQVLG
jgi:hypothetical protein